MLSPEATTVLPERPAAPAARAADLAPTWPPDPAPVPPPRRAARGGPGAVIAALSVAALTVLGALLWTGRVDQQSNKEPNAGGAGGPVPAGLPGGLAYRFDVGTTYRYTVTALMQGTLTAGGSPQPYREDASATVSVTPTSVADNGVVTATIEQVDARSVVNGHTAALSPASATVRIRPDGAVIRVSNPFGSAMLQEAMLGFPGVNQFLPVLPSHRVDDGDSWQATVTQELPDVDAALSFETASTLVGSGGSPGRGVVVLRGHVELPLDVTFDAEPALEAMNVAVPPQSEPAVAFSGSAALDTTVEFDRAKGALRTMNSQGELEMAVRYDDFPRGAAVARAAQFSGWIGLMVREATS
jgi:hypothetical protein